MVALPCGKLMSINIPKGADASISSVTSVTPTLAGWFRAPAAAALNRLPVWLAGFRIFIILIHLVSSLTRVVIFEPGQWAAFVCTEWSFFISLDNTLRDFSSRFSSAPTFRARILVMYWFRLTSSSSANLANDSCSEVPTLRWN